MDERVLVLGAGFGGLELSTVLSEALGDSVEVTLVDKGDAFVFGYSKLDVMFGRASADAVRLPYARFAKPGVRMLKETVTAIDPHARRVRTDAGEHEADFLVIALGADYDMDATPGLGKPVTAVDGDRGVATLADGSELPFELFLGVPTHRAPEVVLASGMTEDGYIPVDPATLKTRHEGVYAVGDVASAGVPKAGV